MEPEIRWRNVIGVIVLVICLWHMNSLLAGIQDLFEAVGEAIRSHPARPRSGIDPELLAFARLCALIILIVALARIFINRQR